MEFGVRQVADRIHKRLQRYLEAQYHIRDNDIIEERRQLLIEPGAISQRPFVEITPSYATARGFDILRIPDPVRNLLSELVTWNPSVGVFPPYVHQAEALEAYFTDSHDGSDLIVATGTGSGKTETFLYTILGILAIEGTERPDSFRSQGIRALLLYPMNALVSDQTARLRRLFGDERLASLFRERFGRHPWFGMYTSRTPYPGVRKAAKDKRHIEPHLEYYEDLQKSELEEQQRLVAELNLRGRWPAKDIEGFFGRSFEETKTFQKGKRAGKQYTARNWERRLQTQPGDRELLTRHEMQEHTPDLLVTNYSMLEYMLLRPIERSIFSQTKEWLKTDERSQLLLILDEAHMYRGVGGAEVGLLIRRLQSRLDISRNQLRCILTSASLGTNEESEKAAQSFARGLTGIRQGRSFAIIKGTRETRSGASSGNRDEAAAFVTVDPVALAGVKIDIERAREVIAKLANRLGWRESPGNSADELALRQYVGRELTGNGPIEQLIEICAGNARPFTELAGILFPDVPPDEAERATDGLLALGCFARRSEPGRQEQPLLPTRVHLMFRGLPPVYACVNQSCSARRHNPGRESLVGRLYNEPRTHCDCGARVFELYTHRDCGAAFLRVFGIGPQADFLWHERGGTLTEFGRPLHEIHLLLGEPHHRRQENVEQVWLDIQTGRVYMTTPPDRNGFRLCYRPHEAAENDSLSTFNSCPVCTRRTKSGRTLKIMDLSTKGEQPFANLVREQFVNQIPTRTADEKHPNEGRKALLFSDGRQKAARLARDLPREVERDSFREAIALAVRRLRELGKEAILDETLYAGFVSVCDKYHLHFFDGDDQKKLLEECRRFRTDYSSDLSDAFDLEYRPTPPTRYRQALLRQICDPYYSLIASCAAVVQPRRLHIKQILRRIGSTITEETVSEIANGWIREMLMCSAFDHALALDARQDEFFFFEAVQADEKMPRLFDLVRERTGTDDDTINRVREALFDIFTRQGSDGNASGRLLAPSTLELHLAIDETWLQCLACGNVQLRPFFNTCSVCGDDRLEERPPDHPYMVARKGFFLEPLRAVLQGDRPVHITAEEHTAQLSQRDAGVVYATTEEYELRFQDVPLGPDKPPVDILSCTTTMEVGIDIGSLTAVGLRTVPPQRENYQQRAGRAGRRGTSVSTVLTFAQGGAHDAHYFANPEAIISGQPREPRIKSDNPRLARRHIHSHLMQTFFHLQLDRLSSDQAREIVKERPNIMSSFGTAKDFFHGDNDFSLYAFESWLDDEVLGQESKIVEDISGWLPDEIFRAGSDLLSAKRDFVRKVAVDFLQHLRELRSEISDQVNELDHEEDDRDEEGSVLDILFDRSLLPSYAFPTDLCSFVIHERGQANGNQFSKVRVKERPQLAKAQALSEYAPGRLLVVNKKTYRVGGIVVEGQITASPAASMFSTPLKLYVGCPRCTYVRLETDQQGGTEDGTPCPVCGENLQVREMLKPPAFTPEGGRPVREGDREQEITYASSAQLPELAERDGLYMEKEAGSNLHYSHRDNVLLVIANKGKDNNGFAVCESCGAAWPDGEESNSETHSRPFLIDNRILRKEQAQYRCNGTLRHQLFLGHEFRTDILLLQIPFSLPIDFSPRQPWLYDALATVAEAVALGASLHLDIDPGDLSSGFRLLAPRENDNGLAEIYLFDTASGGAGYADEAGKELTAVLDRTEALLQSCPGLCERSCTRCMRHYGNRFLHRRLDRRLGMQLLRYARGGTAPAIEPVDKQATRLLALARYLQLEGWSVTLAQSGDEAVPLLATPRNAGVTVAVGIFPALLDSDAAMGLHQLLAFESARHVLLPDYLVEWDLPSAYQRILAYSNPLGSIQQPQSHLQVVRSAEGCRVEIPVFDIDMLASAKDQLSPAGTVGVPFDVPAGAFLFEAKADAFEVLGIPKGFLVICRQPSEEDFSDQFQQANLIVVARAQGLFRATGRNWTIATLKRMTDEDGTRGQVSYRQATGSEYRPERLPWNELRPLGIVLHVFEGEVS
ncbi:MAG: DEAD/DEAH box helicase [Acidobacteria bacterium]|nr:DEAD/DEAH box helicase [Acidobacteriota bacterium]